MALCSIHARVADTSVGSDLASLSVRARGADAKVVLEEVDTSSIIQTWIRLASSDVLLAQFPFPSGGTDAAEIIDLVHALSIVEARVRLAFIDLDLTELARVAWVALAFVHAIEVEALNRANGVTGVAAAFVGRHVARQSHESGAALAQESF